MRIAILVIISVVLGFSNGEGDPRVMVVGGLTRLIDEGNDVDLECRKAGGPEANITWTTYGFLMSNRKVKQTNPILHLKDVRGKTFVDYFCEASFYDSKHVYIFFKRAPEVFDFTQFSMGDLRCKVFGFPLPEVVLEERKNGKWIPIDTDHQFSPYTTYYREEMPGYVTMLYRRQGDRTSGSGTYRCRAEGKFGTDSKTLTVKENHPVKAIGKRDVVVYEGEDATLKCEGHNSKEITWYKIHLGNFPAFLEKDKVEVGKGQELRLTNIRDKPTTLYMCKTGYRENVVFRVYVRRVPEIDYLGIGSQSTVTCSAKGYPAPNITLHVKSGDAWKELRPGAEFVVHRESWMMDASGITYDINNLLDRDKQVFMCTVMNPFGDARKVIGLDTSE